MTTDSTAGARALASRRNGARSRGPRTAAGKARVARNALRHGLCAQAHVLLDDEDAAALAALDAAARAELAPAGAFQAELLTRIVSAAWRARRADRLEAALLGRHLAADRGDPQAALGHGLMRDGHGPRALETLVRYRGAVVAELFRSLGALKALQAEARALAEADLPAAPPPVRRRSRRPAARAVEPARTRQSHPPMVRSELEPRHDAPERDLPAAAAAALPAPAPQTKQTRESPPEQGLALRAPGRAQRSAPDRNLPCAAAAVAPSARATTEQTRERAADQRFGLGASRQSTSAGVRG